MSTIDILALPVGREPGQRAPHVVLEASAGTGKTYTIAALVATAVSLHRVSIERILVVTFTRAATKELRERIRGRLVELRATLDGEPAGDPFLVAWLARVQAMPEGEQRVVKWRLIRAIEDIDLAAISTIHSFCSGVLKDLAFEAGLPLDRELVTSVDDRIQQLATDFLIRELQADHAVVIAPMLKWFAPDPSPHSRKSSAATQVASWLCRNPKIEVFPNECGPIVPAEDVHAAYEALRAPSAAFIADIDLAEALIPAVFDDPGINKNKMKDNRRAEAEAFCAAARRDGVEGLLRYAAESRELAKRLTRQGIEDNGSYKKNCSPPDHPGFPVWECWLDADALLMELVETRVNQLRVRYTKEVRTLVPEHMAVAGVQSFDGMLADLYAALNPTNAPPEAPSEAFEALRGRAEILRDGLRSTYDLALIDEFQDTDPVQCGVFEAVFVGEVPLYYVGDPKQAIYKFRGADIHAYLQAVEGADVRTMDTNYRSDVGVVESVNELFSRTTTPFGGIKIKFTSVKPSDRAGNELLTCSHPAPAFRLTTLDPDTVPADAAEGDAKSADSAKAHIAAWVASDIVRQLKDSTRIKVDKATGSKSPVPLRPRDFAILVPSHKGGEHMQAALRARGIPSVRTSNATVLESAEASDLRAILRAIAMPSRAEGVRQALATTTLGKTATQLATLLSGADAAWDEEVMRFSVARERWERQGVLAALVHVLETYDVGARLLKLPDGERRMTNLLHATERIHLAAVNERLGMFELIRWLDQPSVEGDDEELRTESEGDAVTIMTIHKSKGLEFPIVYCPFLLGKALLPIKKPFLVAKEGATVAVMADSTAQAEDLESLTAAAKAEAMQEQARLVYVALTRAKHQVVVPSVRARADEKKKAISCVFDGMLLGVNAYEPNPKAKDKHSAQDWYAAVEAWAAASGGRITHEAIEPPYDGQYQESSQGEFSPIAARTFERKLVRWWVSSFSALKSGSHSSEGPGRDRDDTDFATSWVTPPSASDMARAALVLTREARLEGIRGGTAFGTFVHEVFERCAFDAGSASERRSELEKRAQRHGVDPVHLDAIAAWFERVLATPIAADGFRLSDLPRTHRIDEMAFWVPITHEEGMPTLTERLATAIESHSTHAIAGPLAAKIRTIPSLEVRGYLQGFIDLVYVRDGRWTLVDYKTNRLGTVGEYASTALGAQMIDTLYGLQYHLYAVALHRYLKHTLANYTPSKHFGGAKYLFVRGMAPELGSTFGVFADPMNPALLDALDHALQGDQV